MQPAVIFFFQVSLIVIVYGALAYAWTVLKSMKMLKKQQERFKQVLSDLKPGARVLLSSGLIGSVKAIRDEILDVEVGPGLSLEASVYSVQEILKQKGE